MTLLETQDVARALALSPVRVRQLADAGRLPVAMKTAAGRRLFDATMIEEFRRERARRGANVRERSDARSAEQASTAHRADSQEANRSGANGEIAGPDRTVTNSAPLSHRGCHAGRATRHAAP